MDNQPREHKPVRHIRPDHKGDHHDQQSRRANIAKHDPFPYMISGLITAAVLGLVLVAWLLISPGSTGLPLAPAPTAFANAPFDFPTSAIPIPAGAAAPGDVPTLEVPTQDIALPPPEPTGSPPPADDPPRIALGDFKALYDDPSSRPLILDTRNEQAYSEGHIPGAVLFPASDVVSNVVTLPKDRLIVAYCQ